MRSGWWLVTVLALMQGLVWLLIAPAGAQQANFSGPQQADANLVALVTQPAFVSKHPLIVFDEAHDNLHTAGGSYKPFADLIASDGFLVAPGKASFTRELLDECDILVIANAPGRGSDRKQSAFTGAEIQAVEEWVNSGGALLLITDHPPFGAGSAELAKGFGVDMGLATSDDPANEIANALLFSREKHLLGDHPITSGRNPSERIDRVLTFTGQSLKGPAGSTALLKFADTAVDLGPDGSVSAAGRAQGIALRHGKGRVVVMGEAAELTARIVGSRPTRVGMNAPDCDNRQLALNIMHWLAGLLE